MKIFITGIGSGLGEALAKLYLEAGEEVYAISRVLPRLLQEYKNLHFFTCNLHAHERIECALTELLEGVDLDLAILNAGVASELKDMSEVSLYEIEAVMDINVWANKIILDFLKHQNVKQVVAISSGASVSGSRGWHGYALSKAALNMLIKLYAAEMPNTHLSALAPGIIDTPMLRHIIKTADQERFPVAKRLAQSQKMQPADAAFLLADTFEKLLEYPSGSFLDVRHLK